MDIYELSLAVATRLGSKYISHGEKRFYSNNKRDIKLSEYVSDYKTPLWQPHYHVYQIYFKLAS